MLAAWLAWGISSANATQGMALATVCEQPAAAPACTPQTTTLPYHWDTRHGAHDGSATFTLNVPSDAFSAKAGGAAKNAPAVFLPRIGNAFSISLNGNEMLAVGEAGTQRFDTAKRPYLLALPADTIRAHNTLVITIHAQAGRAAQLAPITLGQLAELTPAYERTLFWRVQVTGALMWMGIVLGLMSLAVWWVQREALFLAYAVAELAWALRLSEMFWVEMPLAWQAWGAGVAVAFATAQLAMSFFFLNAVDCWRGWFRRGFHIYVGLWIVIVPSIVVGRLRDLWVGWLVSGTLMFVALAVFVGWRAFAQRHHWRWLFAAFVLSMVVAGVGDIAESPGSMYMHPTWTRLVWGGFSVALALLVARRLHRNRAALLASNAAMREALASQAIELRLAHEKQAQADLERAMVEERQRVMRDMHDGLGAQLSGMLSMVSADGTPRSDLQAQVRLAIEELRTVVDAMTPFDGNLGTMLGSLRPRLERRLTLAKIALEWAVDELPATDRLTPLQVQHLQRLLLEAMTNIAKHSKATIVRLSARSLPGVIELCVRDNGSGFDTTIAHAGNGLRNMHWRANALGATLTIDGSGGASLVLSLPV